MISDAKRAKQSRRLPRKGICGRYQGYEQPGCLLRAWNYIPPGLRHPPFDGGAQRYELAANGGDAQAQFATGWFLMTGTGVPQDERKGLKWIHKSTFQGYQPAIDYCKEHNLKWY